MSPTVVVLGATGHTGALAVRALLDRGATVRACGRSVDALARLAGDGVETRRVDVTRADDVRAALDGADAVANLAGPFLQTGDSAIAAAIAERVPYLDTTGEQAFMLAARAHHDAAARAANVAVVNAMGFEYAFTDLAVRAHMPEGGESLHVLYRPRGAQASAGTKKSIVRVLATRAHSHEAGKLVAENPGAHTHRFATRDGWRDGISFAGGEALTIPSHTPFRTVRTYAPGRASRARTLRTLAPVARLALRGPALAAVERMIDARHQPPANEAARGEIYLTASRAGDREHLLIETPDPYFATGEIVAEAALRLAREPRAAGVVAPAEALDASSTLAALAARMPSFGVRRLEVLPTGVAHALAGDDKPI